MEGSEMTGREQAKIGALAKEIEKVCDQRAEVNRENVVLHETISILNSRIAALEGQVCEAEAKHQKAFEDGINIVRKANAKIAALEAQLREREVECELVSKDREMLCKTISDLGFGGAQKIIADLEAGIAAQDEVLTAKYNAQLARAESAERDLHLANSYISDLTSQTIDAETALAAAQAENAQIRAIIDEVFGPFQVGTATHVRACVEQLQAELAAARAQTKKYSGILSMKNRELAALRSQLDAAADGAERGAK
jgi:chromosome segregation ATPase